MTDDPTYEALTECARRRISSEWRCSVAEHEMLSLIVDLSYAIGQSWCVVPCLADFAAACGIHKSTASRALRSAVQKGYLQILSRQGETLYTIITTTRGSGAEVDATKKNETRRRLLEMNRSRLQGIADPSGQARLPGVFESEETEAPAAAFDALVEGPTPIDEPLNRLMRTMDLRRAEEPQPQHTGPEENQTSPSVRPQTGRMEVGSYEAQWQEMTRGLNDQSLFCLEQIRSECQQRKGGEAEFFQWRWKWRSRAQKQTRLYLEAAAVCKALRLENGTIPDSPGAFIYRSVQEAVKFTG